MDLHKNRIRDEIQKNIRRYEVLLKRKVEIYRDTLTTREDIYEESRKLVENIIEQNISSISIISCSIICLLGYYCRFYFYILGGI